MSIDYDRLGELLEQWQHGDEVRDQLEAQWDMELAAPNMARELLRLRDGVKQVADDLGEKAEYAPNIPRQAAYTEAEQRLTRLLNGDTE